MLLFLLLFASLSASPLIEGLIDPVTGALILTQIDLIVNGAEPLHLTRTLIPHDIPEPLHHKKKHVDEWNTYFLYKQLKKHYKGWEIPYTIQEKSVLPNGRVIRTIFENGEPVKIESCSPNETLVYATIFISKKKGERTYTTPSGQTAAYKYESLPIHLNIQDKEGGVDELHLESHYPPRLISVASPFFKNETIEYTKEFFPKKVTSKDKTFLCHYKKGKVHKLFYPNDEGTFEPVCEIDYDGKTQVTYSDGYVELFPKTVSESDNITYEYLPNTNLPTLKQIWNGDALISEERLYYDEHNNLIEQLFSSGKKIHYHLRQAPPFLHMVDWIETITPGQSRTEKHLHYDVHGNVCKEVIFSNGLTVSTVERVFNERGDVISETDARGKTTTFTYDDHGRIVQQKTPEGNVITKTYDRMGRAVNESFLGFDGLKADLFFRYNLFGQLIEKSDHLGRKTKFTYEPMTRKLIRIERPPLFDGTPVIEEGDNLELETAPPEKKWTPSLTPKTIPHLERFKTYDSLHREIAFRPPLTLATLTSYEDFPVRIKKTLFPNKTFQIETLDAYDRTVKREIFDEMGQLIYSGDCLSQNAPIKKSLKQTITFPDGSQICYEPNKVLRISPSGSTVYTHELTQNLESLIFDLGKTAFTYDELGRLATSKNPYFEETLHYDYYNQLVLLKEKERVVQFLYDDLGRLIQENKHTWNLDTEKRKNEAFTYDETGRLIRADIKDKTVFFTYDSGKMATREVLGEPIERFIWDGDEMIGIMRGDQIKCLKVENEGRIAAIEIEGQIFAPIMDFQGNVRGLIDPKTEEISRLATYTVFGEGVEKSGLPFGYRGKWYDDVCGFVLVGREIYEPQALPN